MAERSFVERLARESAAWEAEGLVTAEQAQAIRARYGEPEDARGRAASALAVVGAVAVGVGVIAFFAANWDAIPNVLRLLVLVAALVLSYVVAFDLRDRTGRLPRVGAALYLLGVLLFGSSLFLVGQMYNVEAHDPLALLVWAGAAAAVAAVVRTPPLTWAALLIFTAWTGWEGWTAGDGGDQEVAAIAALAMPYGAALYGAGTFVRSRVRAAWADDTGVAAATRGLGVLAAAVGLVVFSFVGAADEVAGAARDVGGGLRAVAIVVAVAALASAAGVLGTGRRTAYAEAAVIAVLALATAVALFTGGDGALWALVFNVALAAVALGAIGVGFANDEAWLVNAGVVLVAVDLVARYFDFFWDALGRSLGIIGSGVVVLAIAYWLERQRKRVLARMAT